MPKPKGSPGRVLHGGEFYTPVTVRESRAGMFLSELRQPEPCRVPHHEHELAYFTVVLGGDYAESDSFRTTELRPFTSVFNPSGVAHTGAIGTAGAVLFTIELSASYLEQLEVRLPEHPVVDSGAGGLFWPGLRAYLGFKGRMADGLTLESHVLEMLGGVTRPQLGQQGAPRWLRRIKDRLHEEFQQNLSMGELAAEVGVHPVHLARVFRAHAGQTPGDYVRRLRVRAACDLLRQVDFPLAGVAAECGFADQSHLTRIFKRFVGTTPGEFRQAYCVPQEKRRHSECRL